MRAIIIIAVTLGCFLTAICASIMTHGFIFTAHAKQVISNLVGE